MDVEPNKLFSSFVRALDSGFDYGLTFAFGSSPCLKDFLKDLDPDLKLDWSCKSFYGLPELRSNIVESQGYDLSADHIMITAGTAEANFLTMTLLLNPGDEIIVEQPTWPQPYAIAKMTGAKVKAIKRREEREWALDMDELEEMASPNTQVIFICSPNNPTGAILDESMVRRLCQIAEKNDAWVLSDEVYRGLELDAPLSPAVVNYYEKAISVASVSKCMGMQGIRTGWIATRDKDLLFNCIALREDTSEIMNVLGEYIALAALKPDRQQQFVAKAKSEAEAGWEVVSDWIEKNPHFDWVRPKAGFLSFPHYNLDIGSEEFSKRLLASPYRTFVHPGAAYDIEHHIRLGVGGGNVEIIKEGLAKVDRLIEKIEEG
jgi:aspartate/methionine/tyrosine aminotransferase